MRKEKIKFEYIILIIVIVVSLLYLILRHNNRINYELPQLKQLEPSKIDKIVIKKINSIVLKKRGENWIIVGDGDEFYKANKESVDKIKKDLSELNVVTLVSERKNYNLYELKYPDKIDVKAFSGKSLIREISIGKIASTYDHTFIKINNDPNVYQAEGSIKDDFNKSLDDLRDKTILSINRNDISSIKIIKGNKEYLLKKEVVKIKNSDSKDKNQNPKYKWVLNNEKLNDKKIESLLNRFTSFDCSSFIYEKDKSELKLIKPIYSLDLITAEKTYNIKIFERKEKDKGEYPAQTSENKYYFYINAYTAEEIMKDPEKFK